MSRFDDLQKQATVPEPRPYRQDTSDANSVTPYGEVNPAGNQPVGGESALEPAPAAPSEVRDLDAPDVQGPVGQSGVYVVNQPPGPTDVPPPGSQAGEALNSQTSDADAAKAAGKAATREEKKAAFFRARANALRERANEFEKRAEAVYQTDVRNLDEPPMVDVGADATLDVLKVVEAPEQLMLADTPDVINDGGETGLPAGPDFRERLKDQINPFNDAALVPYGVPADIPNGVSEVETGRAASVKEEEAARQAREDQRVAAAKTRVLRIANFVDERIDMGLTTSNEKFADIARFEELDDATLDGYIQATYEFKAKEAKAASKRIRVAASEDKGTVRMPSLGSASRPVEDDDDPADDYVAFL